MNPISFVIPAQAGIQSVLVTCDQLWLCRNVVRHLSLCLTGGKTYEVRFSQPPAISNTAGFWSICVYNSKDQFVPNPMKRYNLGDRSPLVKNADGSFTIYVSPRQPKEINNWLPTPEQKEP